jgi:hypothetical protein
VSITSRFTPDLRPTVVSFNTGMLPAFQPTRPNDTASNVLWMAFMDFKAKRLGMCLTVSDSPIAATSGLFVTVFLLAGDAPFLCTARGLGGSSRSGRGCGGVIDDRDQSIDAQLSISPLAATFLTCHDDRVAQSFLDAGQLGW